MVYFPLALLSSLSRPPPSPPQNKLLTSRSLSSQIWFLGTPNRDTSLLPAVRGHLKHSCTATVVFEAFQHLTVLAFGCRLPRLAEYLGSCAEMNSVYPQLRLWLISLCPVVILVHSSPPISCRSVPLFHRWHLTGSLLMTGSGAFVQKNASLVF